MVAVGNDFDLSYERLAAAARAVAAGAPLVTPNVDPRLPIEDGDFLPGCGAIVAAVTAAAGVRADRRRQAGAAAVPHRAARGSGSRPDQAAMVGDSVESDIARRARRWACARCSTRRTARRAGAADVVVRSFAELRRPGRRCLS